ncbi:MAG: hypothetical protein KZQ71_04545 [Candidatus Thiodiazotropha sp. (ex Lucinoma aequizonata)]|nr:hypothetical protein [Candidatus Thiodiazotropha sp. (ex Lucinoma aequizonata)]
MRNFRIIQQAVELLKDGLTKRVIGVCANVHFMAVKIVLFKQVICQRHID